MAEIDIDVRTGHPAYDAAVQQLLNETDIEQLIHHTLESVNVQAEVTLALLVIGDEEMQALNKQYRQQDKPTDVLSFPLLDKPLVHAPADQLWLSEEEDPAQEAAPKPAFVTPPELAPHLGDIVISWPTVLKQAHTAGHTPAYEFLYLLVHGILHLVGYDDQTEAGYTEMVRLQHTILGQPRPAQPT